MSTRIIADPTASTDGAALYDSVTGIAFGPVFADREEAETFLAWLAEIDIADPRQLSVSRLVSLHGEWVAMQRGDE